MRALFTALVASIEAAAVALVGLALVVVPATLLWAITFDLAAEPGQVFGGAIAVWFLAHFVPLGFDIDSQAAVALGLPQQDIGFAISLAPLGLTLVTAVFAARSGWRFGVRGGAGAGAVLGGMLGFGAMAALALPFASELVLWPSTAAVAVPALVYAVCVSGGFMARAASDGHRWWLRLLGAAQLGIAALGLPGAAELPRRAAATIRIALSCVAAVLGFAALGLAVSMVAGYVQVAAVSQALQLDALGALLLFLAQLSLLPVALVWAASWLSGAGFSVGEGTSVTPFETLTGPLPSLPLFGAIPDAWGGLGALAPALIVLAGLAVGMLFARTSLLRAARWSVIVILPVIAAALSGLAFAGLGALARGAIGPDRLAYAGMRPWEFGGLVAVELLVGLLLGVLAGRLDTAKLQLAAAPLLGESRGRDAVTRPEAIDGVFDQEAWDAQDEQETVPVMLHESLEDTGPDEQETVPVILDADTSSAYPDPEPAAEDPEPLPEGSQTVSDEPGTASERPGTVSETPEPAAEDGIDELTQAFSWDRLEGDPLGDEQPEKKPRGWRLPRRDR